MYAHIQEIEQTALVEVADDEPLKIRLLTPRHVDGEYLDSGPDFELLPAHEIELGEDYVTVSYTWAHSESTNGVEIPDYRIWDTSTGNATGRPLRCPPIVFHRAMRYAQARNCPFLWIDQECIDQDDEADIERHLQIMHYIYSRSRWTVAVLSTILRDTSMIDATEEFLGWVVRSRKYGPSYMIEVPAQRRVHRTFSHIARDNRVRTLECSSFT